MKVLFIYPNSESQVGFNYGVACLSAELKEKGVVRTTSVAPIPAAFTQRWRPLVPALTPTQYCAPTYRARASSKASS